ncbi:MAG: CDP-glucose 4,6-dehydratase [Desulfovibrio sp.]
MDSSFWQGKKVFITGHTGFKGAWLAHMLLALGAEPVGYALEPPTVPSLFALTGLANHMESIVADVRDGARLAKAIAETTPDIIIHMAAQPLVRESYANPAMTYTTNVMGTVNLLEGVRNAPNVRSILNVTTDKVYRNSEVDRGYNETDILDGNDPYSNSKSCSELVTRCYTDAFFASRDVAVSTARSGNVIGGGDFAKDRIIPDCIHAALQHQTIIVRNPQSIRPYQHVLEPLAAYLLIAQRQYENPELSGCYNIGPNDDDYATTGELAGMFCRAWGDGQAWEHRPDPDGPAESSILRLDCAKMRNVFDWKPKWTLGEAMARTVDWAKQATNGTATALTQRQIAEFLKKK